MGIDPLTHEPRATSIGPITRPASSQSTRHMAQWESARLEAEARLSRESLPSTLPSSEGDYFLRLWNSEVGETFRKLDGREKVAASSQSPVSCVHNNDEEMEDSSESALQLLFDFPSDNDMSFLEQPDSYGYGLYPAIFT